MQNTYGTGTLALVALLAFGAGLLFTGSGESRATMLTSGPEAAPEGVDFEPVWKAWRLLDEKYVPASSTDVTSRQDRVWGVIEGLAESYDDPYTRFMPPQESKSFNEEISGSFGGVGIEIGIRDNILTVIAPLKGTPGESAGILAGDLIFEVDGMTTKDMTIDDAIEHIRGEVGTEVVLTIAREGEMELLTIPVERAIIDIPTIEHELRPDGVYVIELYNFGGTAVREMRHALGMFKRSSSNKLLLDLRGNPGGFLEAAVDIASWFLPLGTPVVIEDGGPNEERHVHKSNGNDVSEDDWRIAILVDGGSASASEILAGALSEHGKAVLIGSQTFGKGSVQELVEVTPDTSLKITVSRWLTPNGISISEAGLAPDLEIGLTREDLDNDRDPQRDGAVQYLLSGTLHGIATSSPTRLEGVDELE